MHSLVILVLFDICSLQWDGPNCPGNRTSCYDEVDLSLCFEDSAIFYGIVAFFLLLAVFWFISAIPVVCGSQTRPRIPLGVLHVAKLVSRVPLFKVAYVLDIESIIYMPLLILSHTAAANCSSCHCTL